MNPSHADSAPLGDRTGMPPVVSRSNSLRLRRSARGGVKHRRLRLPLCLGGAGGLVLVPAVAVLLLVGVRQASAATLNVCQSGCPYTQLAPALAAAHSGDTITIGPGTYAGGVTIDVSVKLAGAGPGATVISGGGPVLTIGVAGAASEPTVTIDGVTVTGGVAIGNLTPSSGRGGGIYIPRAAGPSTGATVTIRNSVIRGNSVAPGWRSSPTIRAACSRTPAAGGSPTMGR